MDRLEAIRVRHVSVRAGQATLLEDVTLTTRVGEITVILGPNGAGKSTLLRVCAGMLPPDRGEIYLFGQAVKGLSWSALARQRAILPQASSLPFPFSVAEVVALGLRDQDAERHRQRIAKLLAAVDLEGWQDRLYPTLSGGEQQRVQLARILAQARDGTRPFLLLLDEPVSELDLRHQHEVFRLLRRSVTEPFAVVAVVHDLNLALRYADHAVLLDQGRVAVDGKPLDVLEADHMRRVFGIESRLERDDTGAFYFHHLPNDPT